jgi:exonuclease VII large subunit
VLGERLSQVADAGVQHLEKRLRQITAGLERQRDEFVETLDRRLTDAEATLRDRVEAVTAEGRVERDVLDARLRELSSRIDETAARARSRLATLE